MRYFLLLPLRARMRGGGRRTAVFAARNDDDNNLHTKSHCAQNYYLISNQDRQCLNHLQMHNLIY